MRAIGTLLAVTLLGLATSSTDAAHADVVSPPPSDCPSGSYGSTSHGGPYCTPNVCPVSSRQCNPKDCQDAGLCIVEHPVGGRRPPDAAPQFTLEVVGPCDSTGNCSEGNCTTMTVCLGGGGATGRGGATGSGGSASDGGTGGSSTVGTGGAGAGGVNRGGATDTGAAGGSRGGAAGAGGTSAGTGGTSAAQVGGSATSTGGAGGAPVGLTAGSAGTGKAGTTNDAPKVAGCTCRLAAPKSSRQGLGALVAAALLVGLGARRKSRRADFDPGTG